MRLPPIDFDADFHLIDFAENFRMDEFIRASLMHDLAVAHGNDMILNSTTQN